MPLNIGFQMGNALWNLPLIASAAIRGDIIRNPQNYKLDSTCVDMWIRLAYCFLTAFVVRHFTDSSYEAAKKESNKCDTHYLPRISSFITNAVVQEALLWYLGNNIISTYFNNSLTARFSWATPAVQLRAILHGLNVIDILGLVNDKTSNHTDYNKIKFYSIYGASCIAEFILTDCVKINPIKSYVITSAAAIAIDKALGLFDMAFNKTK